MRMPPRAGLILGSGLLVIVAAGILALSDTGSPDRPPAEQIARFSSPATPATVPDAAVRERFMRAFAGLPDGPPAVPSLDLTRIRTFSLGGGTGFAVVAAPRKTGGICWIGYTGPGGSGGCLDSFHNGAGMTEGVRTVGTKKHNVISGLVPDGVSEISFATNAGSFSTPVRNNVFWFVVPDRGPVVESYTLVRANGSRRIEPFGTLGRPF